MTPGDPAATADRRRLVLSFLAFTLLLAGYYLLRPVRDALIAGQGAETIKYLSSAVFVTMLVIVPVFGWLVPRVPRRLLVPLLYGFFVVNLGAFALAFAAGSSALVARGFYVWVTVFNLFAVSVFWSRMADVWPEAAARRYFGRVAAGGSLGGVLGPLLAHELARGLSPAGLVALAALFLLGAALCVAALPAGATAPAPVKSEPGLAEVFSGLVQITQSPFLAAIALLVALGSVAGMFVYIEMARLAASAYPDAAARTAFFSGRDFIVNAISGVLQVAVVGLIAARLGVRGALVVAGTLVTVSFVALGLSPTLAMLTVTNVVLRCTEFGLAKPARDMLYTVLPRDAKYQAKNVIDTAVARGSDMSAGWLHAVLGRFGFVLVSYAGLAAGLAALSTAVGFALGSAYRRRGGR